MPRVDTHHHLAAPACLGPLQDAGIILKHEADAMNASRALAYRNIAPLLPRFF